MASKKHNKRGAFLVLIGWICDGDRKETGRRNITLEEILRLDKESYQKPERTKGRHFYGN